MRAIVTVSDRSQDEKELGSDFAALESFFGKEKAALLVVGRVQSGKTSFIQKIAKLALDRNCDAVFVLAGSNNWLHDQTASRIRKETDYHIEDIRDRNFVQIPREKTIFTCLKSIRSVEKLNELVANSYSQRIVIIDDESDFATINSNSIIKEKTAIHRLLHSVYDNQKEILYVCVTATPYADIISPDSFLFEETIYRVKPGEGYKGLKEFREADKYEIVNEDDFSPSKENIQKWWNLIVEHANRVDQAACSFSQLLINISVRNEEHFELEKFLKLLRGMALNHPHFYKKHTLLEKNESLYQLALELLGNIVVFNQKNASEKNVNDKKHQIVIGGELLSRGYTFESPITCIMFNSAESSAQLGDTLTQRARWFGYRGSENGKTNIFPYMKIYTTRRIYEGYLEAEKLNQVVFDENNIAKIRQQIFGKTWVLIKPTGKVTKNG